MKKKNKSENSSFFIFHDLLFDSHMAENSLLADLGFVNIKHNSSGWV